MGTVQCEGLINGVWRLLNLGHISHLPYYFIFEQHGEGDSVSTESVCINFPPACAYIGEDATDFVSMVKGIDLNFPTFGPGGANPPLYPKY